MGKGHVFSPDRKDRIKAVRSVIQGLILVLILYITVKALVSLNRYVPLSSQDMIQRDKGFIALSYFGVDRTGDEKLISTQRLEEQLKALKESGYVTITQEDIINYYKKGTPLPEKALFLIFEDGRRDTGIFAENIMQKYNFKATMLTYAQNLYIKDPKFLSSKDLRSFEKSPYWEFGTNGYRLSYINVFDRYDNFLNQLDTYRFSELSSYLDRRYDHYLMDYIRDQYGIPMENISQMKERIAYDYKLLKDIYTKTLGKVPDMYILMHSNTGQFGTNERVSRENEKWINTLFKMNFNREGDSLNAEDSSVYDLTRMQPQPYWYTNHLLMRIWDDTGQSVSFVSGDLKRKAYWNTLSGESEFIKDTIVLTSLPEDRGYMELKNSEDYKNVYLSVELKGNKKGSQVIYLRAEEELKSYISCQIKDNELYISEKEMGKAARELFKLDLDMHDGVLQKSLEEDKLDAEIKELETSIDYAGDADSTRKLTVQLDEKLKARARTVQEGAKEYVPELRISEPGDRLVEITLINDRMTLLVDKKPVVKDLAISKTTAGRIGLEASFSGYGYSQRNLVDDVYDGVFRNLVIRNADSGEEEAVLYDNRLSTMDKVLDEIETRWDRIIDWFIKTI